MEISKVRSHFLAQISHGVDPFEGFTPNPSKIKNIGWNSQHSWLTESIDELKPKVILECGVWYGGSVIHMARHIKEKGYDTQIIACDTWLACHILKSVPDWIDALQIKNGRPTFWENFYANIFDAGVQDIVIPLHMDTRSAARYLKGQGVTVDMQHHDATHALPDTEEDLKLLWQILKPGGHLIVDDYIPENDGRGDCMDFIGVTQAVHTLSKELEIPFEALYPKARLKKPL